MFYDIFLGLCAEFNVTPAKVRKDLNISQSTMASWKSRGLTPNAITLVQLAEYFHTTPAYLAGNPLAKNPYDLEQRDQAMRDHVARRFKEATVWKESKDRERLNAAFNSLNPSGQDEAVKRVEELTEIPRYRATVAPQDPLAPSEGTDTTLSPDAPGTPSEDG